MRQLVLLAAVLLLGAPIGCAHAGLAGPRTLEARTVTVKARAAVAAAPAGQHDPYTATDVASLAISVWPSRAAADEPSVAGEDRAIELGGVLGLDSPIVLTRLDRRARYNVRLKAYDWAGLRIDDGSTGCLTLVAPEALSSGHELPLHVQLGDKGAPEPAPAPTGR